MQNIREEIARSRQTVNNDPYQMEDHPELDVKMYADTSGSWVVEVICLTDDRLSVPAQTFPDQASADFHARQCADRIIRKRMNEVRRLIRSLILESQLGFQCNHHSLGFIDDKGDWINCGGMPHGEWLYRNYYDETIPEVGIQIPPNWVKISNAKNIFFCADSFDDITTEQISGLIDMWGDCSKHSQWIQNQTETFELTFATIDPTEGWSRLTHGFTMTVPDFLEKYGGRYAIDDFYGMLLGE